MDITLTLKRNDNTSTPWNEVGDVINVEPMAAGHVSPLKQYLVHITGVPDAQVDNVRLLLTQRDFSAPGTIRNARLWRFDIEDLPATFRDELLLNGETTITWGVARSRMREKNKQIAVRGPHNQADSRAITDLDITNA